MLKQVKQDILNAFSIGDISILKKIAKYLKEQNQLEDDIIEKRGLLFLSLEYRMLPLFSYVLSKIDNPLKKNIDGDDILSFMIKNDYPQEYFEAFITDSVKVYIDLDYKIYGISPLMLAIILNRKKWIELLIPYTRHFKMTLDINPFSYEFVIDYLYDSKINFGSLGGMTILHLATALKQKDTISLLRIEGCPSFLATKERLLPLEMAIQTGSLSLVKELLLFSDLDFVLFYKNKNKQTVFDLIDSLPENYFKKQVFILLKNKLKSFRISTSGKRNKNNLYKYILSH